MPLTSAVLTLFLFSLGAGLSCPAAPPTEVREIPEFTSDESIDMSEEAEVPDGDMGVEMGDVADDGGETDDGGADVGKDALWDDIRLGKLVELDPGPLGFFFEALALLEEGGEGKVRVLHYGDSHTAADFLPSTIRRSLQARFGDGGRGFVLLGQPWRYYMPLDVTLTASGDWQAKRILLTKDPLTMDGRYGLAGVAVDANYKRASARVSTSLGTKFGTSMSQVEFFYMKQPRGGTFSVFVDGRRQKVLKSKKRKIETAYLQLQFEEGQHSVEIRSWGNGPLRVFGAACETAGPGVVYDTLGINGAFFYTPLRWDATMLEEQVSRRNPSLLVTMYGTNEVNSRSLTREKYEEQVREALQKLRLGAPQASCLVLGPPDRETDPDSEEQLAQFDLIIETQLEVAEEVGCAFIDTRELMGGSGSHEKWKQRGLAKGDGIHYTTKGYELLGEILSKRLLEAYEQYLINRHDPAALEQGLEQ